MACQCWKRSRSSSSIHGPIQQDPIRYWYKHCAFSYAKEVVIITDKPASTGPGTAQNRPRTKPAIRRLSGPPGTRASKKMERADVWAGPLGPMAESRSRPALSAGGWGILSRPWPIRRGARSCDVWEEVGKDRRDGSAFIWYNIELNHVRTREVWVSGALRSDYLEVAPTTQHVICRAGSRVPHRRRFRN